MKERIFWLVAIYFGLTSISTLQAQQFDPVLQNLIKKAIEHDHQLKIQDYQIKQTQLDRKKAYKTFLPKLRLNASYTRLNDEISFDPGLKLLLKGTERLLIKEQLGIPFNTPLPSNVPTSEIPPLVKQNIKKASGELEWVLFSGLEATYAIKAGQHKEKALELSKHISQKKTVKELVAAYDRLALIYASEKVIDAARQQLDFQERKARQAVKNGLAIDIDLKRIALARKNLNIKQNDMDHKKELLWEKLHQLTGEKRAVLTELHPKLDVMIIPATLMQQQTKPVEIQSLEEVVQAKSYQEKMTYSKYLPKIALKGHYEFIEDDLSLLDPKWYVGIGIKWQIFDGLQHYGDAKKIEMDKEIYTEKIQQTKELLQLAGTNALLNYKQSMQQIEMNRTAVDLAKETYDLVQKQYKNGLTDISDVLQSLTKWQEAGFKLQKAVYNQRKAAVEILYLKDQLLAF